MSCKISVRKNGAIPVLVVDGDLTGAEIAKVAKKLETIRKGKAAKVAVDLSQTTFIDSHGLGAFVYSWRLLEEEKRQLVFLNPSSFVRNTLNGTNLDKVFIIVESEEKL